MEEIFLFEVDFVSEKTPLSYFLDKTDVAVLGRHF
jgi:hypothetical protein